MPFQSLITTEGRYLVEDYPISYLSSASLMKFVTKKKQKAEGGVLSFGNADLENPIFNLNFAEMEASEIAGMYPKSELYIRRDATETKAKILADKYSMLHFATHSELNQQNPMKSALKLAKDSLNDGDLTAEEVFSLSINSSLVVLSACETAIGKINRGDELVGFTRAFIYAGTPSIINTLWKVDDLATSQLMTGFYSNLKKTNKRDALREAQLAVKKQYEHPYFWAAFQLTGMAE